MALTSWIYHFWARFWPYFDFVDFRAYFGPFSLVNRVQFTNADAGAWNSFLRLGIIFYGKLMHKDTKFCYLRFDISTFGFKAPPYPSPPKTGHCNQALRGSSAPAPQPAGIVFKLLIHDSTVSSLLLVLLGLLDLNQPAVNHVGGHHQGGGGNGWLHL